MDYGDCLGRTTTKRDSYSSHFTLRCINTAQTVGLGKAELSVSAGERSVVELVFPMLTVLKQDCKYICI